MPLTIASWPRLELCDRTMQKNKSKKCRCSWKKCAVGRRSMLIQNSDHPWFQLISRFLLCRLYSCNNAARWEYWKLHCCGNTIVTTTTSRWLWEFHPKCFSWILILEAAWHGCKVITSMAQCGWWASSLIWIFLLFIFNLMSSAFALLLLILQNPDLGIVVLWTSLEEVLYLFL